MKDTFYNFGTTVHEIKKFVERNVRLANEGKCRGIHRIHMEVFLVRANQY
jgi:hypothetical protein